MTTVPPSEIPALAEELSRTGKAVNEQNIVLLWEKARGGGPRRPETDPEAAYFDWKRRYDAATPAGSGGPRPLPRSGPFGEEASVQRILGQEELIR